MASLLYGMLGAGENGQEVGWAPSCPLQNMKHDCFLSIQQDQALAGQHLSSQS